ncbi:MAG: hypothetical protein HUU35_15460 [Armatimonadetes bacterium]|nr:hypothetical protein [Armatimonadota bacterium]
MNQRALHAITLVLLALLSGCGGGAGGYVEVGESGTGRSRPLVGWYFGSLRNYGRSVWLDFRLDRDGAASGVLRFEGDTPRITLSGQVNPDRTIRLQGGEVTITGEFSGAYNPYDQREYIVSGVHFVGTWRGEGEAAGSTDAWHESWPPAPNYDYNDYYHDDYYDDDYISYPWPDDDDDYSGGGNGGGTGGGSGGNGGGGGFDPPDTGGGDPPNTGGDPTNDDVILRRGQPASG